MLIGDRRDSLLNMNDAICDNEGVFFKNDDEFVAYYTASYIIRETEIVVNNFLASGFMGNEKYSKLLAVLNAIYIQQDCLKELYIIFLRKSLIINEIYKAWDKIRELRNRIAGHPINSGYGNYRSFTTEDLLNGFTIQFEQYEKETTKVKEKTTHHIEDLQALINDYDKVGAVIFDELLEKIRPYYNPDK